MLKLKATYQDQEELTRLLELLEPFSPQVGKEYKTENPKAPYRTYIEIKSTSKQMQKRDYKGKSFDIDKGT